jgi:hypothetical protein
VTAINIIELDRKQFAQTVARAYYASINDLLQAAARDRSGAGAIIVSGPDQWKATHLHLFEVLVQNCGPMDSTPIPHRELRDAYIRAMIALYLSDKPKPIVPQDVVKYAQTILSQPAILPSDMQGYDLAMTPVT